MLKSKDFLFKIKIEWGEAKGEEHDFWLKFSGEKNLGGNYD